MKKRRGGRRESRETLRASREDGSCGELDSLLYKREPVNHIEAGYANGTVR